VGIFYIFKLSRRKITVIFNSTYYVAIQKLHLNAN